MATQKFTPSTNNYASTPSRLNGQRALHDAQCLAKFLQASMQDTVRTLETDGTFYDLESYGEGLSLVFDLLNEKLDAAQAAIFTHNQDMEGTNNE